MAEWNQIGGALRRHDAGEPCDFEHIALGGPLVTNERQSLDAHSYEPARACQPSRDLFGADINHPAAAAGIEMGQVTHRSLIKNEQFIVGCSISGNLFSYLTVCAE